jgi:Flp pilus assembly pilin Flp
MSQEIHAALELDDGQTMAEYAVVLGIITIAVVTTIGTLSGAVNNLFAQVVGLFT